jgi:branched-chain amino acid transport system permease protein
MTRLILLQVLNGISFGMLLFLLSSGLSLIYGLMRIVNLAHGSLYVIGGYVTLSVFRGTSSFVLAALAGALAATAGGLVIYWLLRFQRGDEEEKETQQILLTFGILLVVRTVTRMIWGSIPVMLDLPQYLRGAVRLGPLIYPQYRLTLIVMGAILGLIAWWIESRTRLGALLRAAVEDGETARAMGINVPGLFISMFCAGACLAGLSGALGGAFSGLNAASDIDILVLAFAVTIVGGAGSMIGALLGALAIGLIDSFGRTFIPQLALVLVFLPVVGILMVRARYSAGQ